jgi:hypothetical protein
MEFLYQNSNQEIKNMNALKDIFPVEKRIVILLNLDDVSDIRKIDVNTNHVLTSQEITNMIVGAGLNPALYYWWRGEEIRDIRN